MTRNITCISCPVGCSLAVTLENGAVVRVEGNDCPRGEIYAKKECVNPTRIFTSSVPIIGGETDILSVKSAGDIPKDMIYKCAEALRGVSVKAPVQIGDIVVENIADTGVDLVATRNIRAVQSIEGLQ